MRSLKRLLKETFGFSKTEMNATWLLLATIFLLAIVPRIYFQRQRKELAIPKSDQNLISWNEKIKKSLRKVRKDTLSSIQNQSHSHQSKKITHFRQKKQLWSNRTPDSKKNAPTEESKPAEPIAKLDLNASTAEELMTLRGIGPVLSQRIIKYRISLGGFFDVSQLKEVYGLSPEALESIQARCEITSDVNPITLNTDSAKHLFRHPYINKKLAYSIVNYRKVHGDYQVVSDLKQLKLMNDSLYQRLYPYISIAQ